jgi:hypothetical protein
MANTRSQGCQYDPIGTSRRGLRVDRHADGNAVGALVLVASIHARPAEGQGAVGHALNRPGRATGGAFS